MTDVVTIVNGKLEGNDVRIMLDSGFSVSLIDKGSVPKQCIVSGQMPQLQTADEHKLTVMGTVKAQLQLEQFSTEHGFLVTNMQFNNSCNTWYRLSIQAQSTTGL